jgi:hypothetical protein
LNNKKAAEVVIVTLQLPVSAHVDQTGSGDGGNLSARNLETLQIEGRAIKKHARALEFEIHQRRTAVLKALRDDV